MRTLLLISLTIALATLISCNKCRKEDPRARVVNSGTENVSVHIETTGGNTININNIDAGQMSDYESYAEGLVEFTITVGNGGTSVNYVQSVEMETCYEYDIVLDANNNITSVPTDRNE